MLKIRKLFLTFIMFLVLTFFTVALGACSGAGKQYTSPVEAPEIGMYAPGFQLNDIDGENIRLVDLAGKPIVLNFWATWCGYCVDEMPLLQEMYDAQAAEGLVMFAVNSGETNAQANNFMQTYGYSFPVLLDSNQVITMKYEIRGLPTTFFIDKDGIIRDIKVGAFLNKAQIENSLEKILP